MKKIILTLLITFTINASAQYAIVSAVDVKDGMEEQYLALEAFFGPIHDLAIEKGMLNSQAVFKVLNTSDDGENVADYFIISGFSSKEQLDAYNSNSGDTWLEIAKQAIKRKTGARGLRSIMEDVMLDVMFDLPDNTGSSYLIEAAHVDEKQPILPIPAARPKSA